MPGSVTGMIGFRVRRATADDESFLRDMLHEALYVPPGSPPFRRSLVESPHLAPYVADFGRQPGDVGFIALVDDAPVGAVWARLPTADHRGYGYVDDDTPELSMAVVADHRRQGVGTALLERLIEVCARLSLSVGARNPAVRLYERAGFEPVGDDGNSLTMLRTASAQR